MKCFEPNFDFKGAVSEAEIITESLFEQSDATEKRLESKHFCRFDEFKNLVEAAYLMPDSLNYKTIYKYNPANQLIESQFYQDDSLTNRTEFLYDLNNRLIEKKFFDKDSVLLSTNNPVYTKEGWQIDENFFDSAESESKHRNGAFNFTISPKIKADFSLKNVRRIRTIKDADDRFLEAAFYKKRNRILGKIFVVYDEAGKAVEINKYGDDRIMEFDSLNPWKKFLSVLLFKSYSFFALFLYFYKLSTRRKFKNAVRCLFYGMPYDETVIDYDDDGKVKEIRYFSSFGDSSRVAFRYDENGNETEKIVYTGATVSHQQIHGYEYDAGNNWIKKKTFFRIPSKNTAQFTERTVLTSRAIKHH